MLGRDLPTTAWQQGTSNLFIKSRLVSSTWVSERLFRWEMTTRNIPFIHQMKTCLLHLGLGQAVPLGPDSKEHPIYSSKEGLSSPPGTGCSAGWQQGICHIFIKLRPVLLHQGLLQAVPLGPDIKDILFINRWWWPVLSDFPSLMHPCPGSGTS